MFLITETCCFRFTVNVCKVFCVLFCIFCVFGGVLQHGNQQKKKQVKK